MIIFFPWSGWINRSTRDFYHNLSHKRVSLFEQSSQTGCIFEQKLIVIHRFTDTLVSLTGTVPRYERVLKVHLKHYTQLHLSNKWLRNGVEHRFDTFWHFSICLRHTQLMIIVNRCISITNVPRRWSIAVYWFMKNLTGLIRCYI